MALTPVRRRWLLVELVVLALPTTIVLLYVMGTLGYVSMFSNRGTGMGAVYSGGRGPVPAPLIAWALMGFASLVGFWRIAGSALLGHSVREIAMAWWLMMKTGMLFAVIVCIILLFDLKNLTPGLLLMGLLAGPALLVPATHLLFERRAA